MSSRLAHIDRAALVAHWSARMPIRHIAARLGTSDKTVRKIAAELGLRDFRRHGYSMFTGSPGHSIGGCIKHRKAIRQPSPIGLRQSASLIGAPIRILDPETRALIDAALTRPPGVLPANRGAGEIRHDLRSPLPAAGGSP